MSLLDFDRFEVLTFDCYGTLIDWETGILNALAPLRRDSGRDVDDDVVLERYALVESRIQSGPYKTYRRVLAEVGGELASFLGVGPEAVEDAFLADSITRWEPFADTVPALAKLEQRYRLAIVSNIDDDLISASLHKLRADFDPVVTAEQVGSYKPSRDNFLAAIERAGVEKDRILHVAQSLYHDIQPANELGLSNVWVNRRKGKPGAGATFPADASPTMEVPDLATLASIACQ